MENVATRWWGWVVLALVVWAMAGCDADRAEAVRYYNEGLQEYNTGSMSQAVGFMERAMDEDPTFHEAAYTLGQIYQQRMNNPEDAAANYRRALDHAPEEARYAYRLGTVLMELEDYAGALDRLEEAVELDPDAGRMWYAHGRAHEAKGQFPEAVQSFTRAIETEPRLRMDADDPGGEHYHALGDLYHRFRLYDHAVRVFENGVQNNADSPRLYHGKGMAQLALGRADEAVESFEAALTLDERYQSAHYNLAVALNEAERSDDAREKLRELVEDGVGGLSGARYDAASALLERLEQESEDD